VIVVPNDLLKRQMQKERLLYLQDKNVCEMRIDEIEAGLDHPNRVYLVDEADWVLSQGMVSFNG
jgi:hypothetical protein